MSQSNSSFKLNSAEIRMALLVLGVAFFFTHGLPLWDDDYGKWLKQANDGFFSIMIRLISPFTSEPTTWGYSDRPGQVFIFKFLNLFFGYWGTGFFLIKSAALAMLGVSLARWLNALNVEKKITNVVIALFVLSPSTITSLVWHSDFSIYAQLILSLLLIYSFSWIHRNRLPADVYEHGFSGIPHQLKKFLMLFFVVVYLGAKVKGDVRLAPVVLLTYLYIYEREQFKIYFLPFGLTLLATLPWSADFFKHLPPFVPGAQGYQGTTYSTFSVMRLFDVVTGKASLFSSWGYLVFCVFGLYGVFLLTQGRLKKPDSRFGFMWIWLTFAILTSAIMPVIYPIFQTRYVFMAIVPMAILSAMIFQSLIQTFSMSVAARAFVFGVCVLQCGWNFYGDYVQRMNLGHVMVATQNVYDSLEKTYPSAIALFAPNFKVYGYKETDVAASIKSRKQINPGEDIRNYPANNTIYVTWNPSLDARFSLATSASGCGSTLFDLIFPCRKTDGALMLRYIGDVPEIISADQLDKQGKLLEAQQTLEAYVKRDPGNHGAAFILSLYYDRTHNHAKMDEVYGLFGEYFPDHTSVLYNWGVAKLGLQKYKEAASLFETAFKITPRDISIGLNLADSYYHIGKKARALTVLSELQTFHPGNTIVKDLIDKWSKQ
jgi:tetratricopeptide (TPR) repeat protein